MKNLALVLVLVMPMATITAQEIDVTFTGYGMATEIDSVVATNFTTNQRMTIPGNATLVLTSTSSNENQTLEPQEEFSVYPNPFTEQAFLSMHSTENQIGLIQIVSISGRIVCDQQVFLNPGVNRATLQIGRPGLYFARLTTKNKTVSTKILNQGHAHQSTKMVSDLWFASDPGKGFNQKTVTETNPWYMAYTKGDVMHYKCFSSQYKTVIVDSLFSSKNYEVEFFDCTDRDERTYCVVKIGDQVWMEENLAYLPSINRKYDYSDTVSHYYVWGYTGTELIEAKAKEEYQTYGVLYNWAAANDGCPDGWHLPTVQEYEILTDYLFNNYFGFGGRGNRINKSLASREGWNNNTFYASPGNNQLLNNRSGFNAKPAGYYISGGSYFNGLHTSAIFWTSTPGAMEHEAYATGFFQNTSTFEAWADYSFKNGGNAVRCIKD